MIRYIKRSEHPFLLFMIIFILAAGLIGQIVLQVSIASENRKADSIRGEIAALSATVDNLEHSIDQYHDLDRIGSRAQQLGMSEPTAEQIRVVGRT